MGTHKASTLRDKSQRRSSAKGYKNRAIRNWRLLLEPLEQRQLLSANPVLSMPSGLNAFQNGVVAVPVLVNQFSDNSGNSGLSTADLAINFDSSVFTVSSGDIFQGTGPVSAASLLSFSASFASGQLRISITDPTAAISSAVGTGTGPITITTSSALPAGLNSLASVDITGVTGFAAANGTFSIKVTGSNTFTLDGTNGDVGSVGGLGTWAPVFAGGSPGVTGGAINDSLAVIDFHVKGGAPTGSSTISLVSNNSLGGTDMSAANGAESAYSLSLPVNGSVNVEAAASAPNLGSYTALSSTPPDGIGTMLQLTDGSVMFNGGNNNAANDWYRLIPDSSGSYVNGSFQTLASSNIGRLFFGSVVMQNGDVMVLGGEYSNVGGSISSVNGPGGSSPITVTISGTLPSDMPTGSIGNVTIKNVSGFSAANGNFTFTVTGSNTFTLGGTTGDVGTSSGSGTFSVGETNTGEIFTPPTTSGGTGSWANITPFPQSEFGDGNLELMTDGTVLAGDLNSNNTWRYNPTGGPGGTWTQDASLPGAQLTNAETAWTKLPDGSIVSYELYGFANDAPQAGARFVPGATIAQDQWVAAGSVPIPLGETGGASVIQEIGPGILLPDGRVFHPGANGNTALYSSPALAGNSTGNWVAGPVIPNGEGANDAPAAMMTNGDVLFAASPYMTNGSGVVAPFNKPTDIYEYNPATNTITDTGIQAADSTATSTPGFETRMLDLPNGQVLFSDSSSQGYVYTPSSTPNGTPTPLAAWRPVIDNIKANSPTSFTLTGTQITGLSEGAAYGDDAQMASNYPIVRFTDGGGTFYATTTNWSTAGVQTGPIPETVQFTLPAGHPLSGITSFTVIANGIPSEPTQAPLVLDNTQENVTIQVDPHDSTKIQVLLSNTNTVIATYANNSPDPIVVIGDANNNSVTVNEANGVVNTPITFDGGGSPGAPGDQMIVIGNSGDDTLKFAPSGPASANMTFDGSPVYSFNNIQRFAFDGGTGNDLLAVDSTFSLLNLPGGIQYNGGTGFNTLQLTQTGGKTQTSDTYSVGPDTGEGTDVIVGGGNTQTVYFQNLAPVQDNVPATTVTVNATPAANAINYVQGPGGGIFGSDKTGFITIDTQESYEFSQKPNLVVNGQAGSDEINLNDPTTPTGLTGSITVNGSDPTASDTLIVNGIPGTTDHFVVFPTATGSGNILDTDNGGTNIAPVVNYTGIEGINVVGQITDSDALAAAGTAAGDVFTYDPGAAPSSGQITGFTSSFTFAPLSFSGITGFVTMGAALTNITPISLNGISGPGGNDTVVIDGTGADDSFNWDASLLAPEVRVDTGANLHTPIVLVGDQFTGFVSHTIWRGLDGNDTFNVAPPKFIAVANFDIRMEGDDSDPPTLNYTTAANAATTVDLGASTIASTSANTVTLSGIVNVNLISSGATSTLTVKGTAGDDNFAFAPSAVGAGSFTATATGAVVLTSPQFTYTGVGNGITVDGGAGGFDVLGLAGTPGNDTINGNQTTATHLDFTLNAFTQPFTMASMEGADITAGAGDDVISVSVADALVGSLRFNVDGGGPNASDRLLVNDAGAGDLDIIRQAPDGRSGSVNVGALNPVNYQNIERVDITSNGAVIDPTTGTTGTDHDGRIVVFHSDPFEYNDTILNATQLSRVAQAPNSPNIDPAALAAPAVGGDEDWYQFRPLATGTFQITILFDKIGTLGNGRPGLPGDGDLNLDIYDGTGAQIVLPVAGGTPVFDGATEVGKSATFAATNDPAFPKFNRIYVRVHGATTNSINTYDFDNLLGIGTGIPGVSSADIEGPQVTKVQVNSTASTYDLFGEKAVPPTQGPTPLVTSLIVTFQDQPARAPGFLYPALDYMLTPDQARGLFQVKGDSNGIVAIDHVVIINNAVTPGNVPTATVQLFFVQPLPDDRFTFTINDSLRDPAGNKLDGESNAAEPNGAPGKPNLPSGDGHPGGDFVARFTIDTRPEIAVYGEGSVYADTNGNFTWDPNNPDASNRDFTYTFGLTTDDLFTGDFPPSPGGTADGFSKLAAYGKVGSQFRWLIDNTNAGVPNIVQVDPAGINGIPVAGNFDGNATNGDEVGLFTGKAWYFAPNGVYKINLASKVTSQISGAPIVGDFDGDTHVDLATYANGVFSFQLWNGTGYGGPGFTPTINFGPVPGGVRARPVAADMNHDGITDVGLFVPDVNQPSGSNIGDWYWLISNGPATPGHVTALNHKFSVAPLGSDLYAQFGSTFDLPLVGNFDPPVSDTGTPLNNPVALQVNLVGTPQNDKFQFGPGTTPGTWRAVLNGTAQTYTASSIQVTFDGLGGTDYAVVHGSGSGQTDVLRPGSGDFSGPGYNVHVTAESITTDAGGGSGQATFYGVAGKKDYFTGTATSATMTDKPGGAWKSYSNRAVGLTAVAYSSTGDADQATLYAAAGGTFNAYDTYAQFGNNLVNGFRYVTGYGSGQSTANLYALSPTDTLVADPNTAKLSGVNFTNTAVGFKQVNVYGVHGGKNAAKLSDLALKSLVQTSPTATRLSNLDPKATGYAISVHDFASVAATLLNKQSKKVSVQAIDAVLASG
ncbi:MAG: VCBS repeat-containing protein [Thermoguttaceae bacterium]